MQQPSSALLKKLGFSPMAGSFRRVDKGGSCRNFTFFRDGRLGRGVLCIFDGSRPENLLYARIAKFLKSAGVDVFDVWYSSVDDGILVMQRAGDRDLLSLKDKPRALERGCLGALENVAKMHIRAASLYDKDPFDIMDSFDEKLYRWERDYFRNECAIKRFGFKHSDLPDCEFDKISSLLLGQRLVLIHRDFQSQNIMIDGCRARFIDFQGMRFGCAWYDVASLAFDPYLYPSPLLREKMFDFYFGLTEHFYGLSRNQAKDLFYAAACQRLCQALGAYCFLADTKGKREYLKYIHPAALLLKNASEVCGAKHIERAAGEIAARSAKFL